MASTPYPHAKLRPKSKAAAEKPVYRFTKA